MTRLVVDRLVQLRKRLWIAWQFIYDTDDTREACTILVKLAEEHKMNLRCLRLRRVSSEGAMVNAKREIEEFWRGR